MGEFVWVQDRRFDDYYYLEGYGHLVATKVNQFSERFPQEHWEAIVFEDSTCQTVKGREEFLTEQQAKASLEAIVQMSLKNKS